LECFTVLQKNFMINILCVSNLVDQIIYGMFSELKSFGYKAYIIATSEEQEKRIKKINCIPIRIPNYGGKINFKAIKNIRRVIKQHHIHVTYCINSSDLSNALFASLGTTTKVVAYRGTQAKIRKTDPTYYLGILNPRVDHVVCATMDIKEALKKHYPSEALTYNPKPYKLEWVAEAEENPKRINKIPENAFVVICIALTKGRPFKGLTQLIEGMQLINNNDIHLVHIGDYEESDYQLAQNGKNAAQIHLIGKKDNAINYLPNADVCICPSTRDASPRSLREAMACGISCIVTDIPGARDLVVNQKTGLVIPPNNPKAIAEALSFLAENRKLNKAFGKAGKEYIQKAFSMDTYLERFDKVFRKVVKK